MKKNKGFTLVELLVVIVIIGVIAGISIPLIRNISGTFDRKKYKTYADSLVSAAKLYNDSYSEDLFGHNENGCAYVTYDQLVGKDLIKDINVEKMSCNSSSTFVRILKVGDKYSYVSFLGCGTKKNGKVEKVSYTLPVEGKTSNEMNPEYCTGVDENNLLITANPEKAPSYDKKKATTKLKIQSGTGINTSIEVYSKWITKAEKDANNYDSISGLSKIGFKVKGDQQSMILNGNIISTTSGTLTTPENVSGDYYLLVKVEHLEDLYGSQWKNTKTPNSKYLVFGPFGVDNEPPKINKIRLTSQDENYNTLTAKVELNVTDNLSSSSEIKICNDLNGTCSPSTKYTTSYNHKFTGSLDGKERTLYVSAKDLAGNISRKSATYKVGVTHTLTYDSNGGTACSPKTKTVNHNSGDNKTWGDLCTPTRKGYKFEGWNTAKDGSGTKITKDTKITKNLTVYAQWKKYYVYISYNVNGGSLSSNHGDGIGVKNSLITLNGSTLYTKVGYNEAIGTNGLINYNNASYANIVKTGYQAVSGKEWKAGTKTYSQSNETYKSSDFCDCSQKDCEVVLNVNWEIQSYSITYTLNGGSVSGNPTSYNVNSNAITLKNPTRTGYTFTGWTGSNGSTPQTSVTIPKGSTGNKSYTANWRKNKVYIAYHVNGGSLGTNHGAGIGVSNSIITLNGSTLYKTIDYGDKLTGNGLADYNNSTYINITKSGYTAKSGAEWIGTKEYNQATNYAASDFCDCSQKDCYVTLKVNWQSQTYTISYNLDGGSVSGNPTSYTVNSNAITLKNPTKTGHTFTGWTGSNGSTAQTSVTIPKGSTGNKSYTANWSKASYTLKYDSNGGSSCSPSSITKAYNTAWGTLCAPTRTGYTFSGWYNGSTKVTATSKATANITVKAKWKMKKPATPTITNPKNGVWTNKSIDITYKTNTPQAIVGKWYYQYTNYAGNKVLEWKGMEGEIEKTTPETKEMNSDLYIWVCNKEASGSDDSSNCSDKAKTTIKLDKTPPVFTITGASAQNDTTTYISFTYDGTNHKALGKFEATKWLSYEFSTKCTDNKGGSGCTGKKYVVYRTQHNYPKKETCGDIDRNSYVLSTNCSYSSGAGVSEEWTEEWFKEYDNAGNESNIAYAKAEIKWK